ncbi:EF-hand domain [Dillenia turbinata]|uniref:EF-hand domain n=1 Tax=Dillenia turbinata TaxID=194707 RepID=A0AAN8W319_9MAGN
MQVLQLGAPRQVACFYLYIEFEKMVISILLLALLFIVGLVNSFYHIPTKKIIALIQSFYTNKKEKVHGAKTFVHMDDEKSNQGITNMGELKRVFATFDKNGDGFITKQELRESLKNIGIFMKEKDVEEMVEKMDSNGDGLIELGEFRKVFESAKSQESKSEREGGERGEEEKEEEVGEDDLKEAFDVFDENKDGLITVEELGLVLSSLGLKEGNKTEDCKEMIRKVDIDGDGMVNFDEFKKMMKDGRRLISVF